MAGAFNTACYVMKVEEGSAETASACSLLGNPLRQPEGLQEYVRLCMTLH